MFKLTIGTLQWIFMWIESKPGVFSDGAETDVERTIAIELKIMMPVRRRDGAIEQTLIRLVHSVPTVSSHI
jgi:hypothetical protein